MPRRSAEHQLQAQVAAYLRLAMPPGTNWTAIDHGGTSARRGAMLMARGVKSGVPDLHFTVAGKVCWIELKSWNGKLSAVQKAFMEAELAAGAQYAICTSVEEVELLLSAWGVPLRATVRSKKVAA